MIEDIYNHAEEDLKETFYKSPSMHILTCNSVYDATRASQVKCSLHIGPI